MGHCTSTPATSISSSHFDVDPSARVHQQRQGPGGHVIHKRGKSGPEPAHASGFGSRSAPGLGGTSVHGSDADPGTGLGPSSGSVLTLNRPTHPRTTSAGGSAGPLAGTRRSTITSTTVTDMDTGTSYPEQDLDDPYPYNTYHMDTTHSITHTHTHSHPPLPYFIPTDDLTRTAHSSRSISRRNDDDDEHQHDTHQATNTIHAHQSRSPSQSQPHSPAGSGASSPLRRSHPAPSSASAPVNALPSHRPVRGSAGSSIDLLSVVPPAIDELVASHPDSLGGRADFMSPLNAHLVMDQYAQQQATLYEEEERSQLHQHIDRLQQQLLQLQHEQQQQQQQQQQQPQQQQPQQQQPQQVPSAATSSLQPRDLSSLLSRSAMSYVFGDGDDEPSSFGIPGDDMDNGRSIFQSPPVVTGVIEAASRTGSRTRSRTTSMSTSMPSPYASTRRFSLYRERSSNDTGIDGTGSGLFASTPYTLSAPGSTINSPRAAEAGSNPTATATTTTAGHINDMDHISSTSTSSSTPHHLQVIPPSVAGSGCSSSSSVWNRRASELGPLRSPDRITPSRTLHGTPTRHSMAATAWFGSPRSKGRPGNWSRASAAAANAAAAILGAQTTTHTPTSASASASAAASRAPTSASAPGSVYPSPPLSPNATTTATTTTSTNVAPYVTAAGIGHLTLPSGSLTLPQSSSLFASASSSPVESRFTSPVQSPSHLQLVQQHQQALARAETTTTTTTTSNTNTNTTIGSTPPPSTFTFSTSTSDPSASASAIDSASASGNGSGSTSVVQSGPSESHQQEDGVVRWHLD